MVWTHRYDFLLKIIFGLIVILIFVNVPLFFGDLIFSIIIWSSVSYLLYNLYIRSFSSYLYCRYTLKMPLTYKEAGKLNEAFSPVSFTRMEWLPMKEIIDADPDVKYQLALAMLNQWQLKKAEENNKRLEQLKQSNWWIRLTTVLYYVLIVYLTIATFLELYPMDLIARWTCKWMGTSTYYPMLNFVIVAIALTLLFRFLGADVNLNAYRKK